MLLVDTEDAITFLVGGDSPLRQSAKNALYSWRRKGWVRKYGTSVKGGNRWSLDEVSAALARHVEEYGAPPWEHGRRPRLSDVREMS